jgi:hypothetical protein
MPGSEGMPSFWGYHTRKLGDPEKQGLPSMLGESLIFLGTAPRYLHPNVSGWIIPGCPAVEAGGCSMCCGSFQDLPALSLLPTTFQKGCRTLVVRTIRISQRAASYLCFPYLQIASPWLLLDSQDLRTAKAEVMRLETSCPEDSYTH